MMPVGVGDRRGRVHAIDAKPGNDWATVGVYAKGVSPRPIAEDNSDTIRSVGNDRGTGPLDPGLKGKILQPQARRVAQLHRVTAAIECETQSDLARAIGRVAC